MTSEQQLDAAFSTIRLILSTAKDQAKAELIAQLSGSPVVTQQASLATSGALQVVPKEEPEDTVGECETISLDVSESDRKPSPSFEERGIDIDAHRKANLSKR